MAFGHGTQDAQKTMGVITLALVTSGHLDKLEVPVWVILAAAGAISLGTMSGGWRIMRTLGRKVIKVDPAAGFAAQTVASSVMLGTAYIFAVPVSTTHVITSSIMGVGSTKRLPGGAVGGRRQHHDRLGAHAAGSRDRRRGDLLPVPPVPRRLLHLSRCAQARANSTSVSQRTNPSDVYSRIAAVLVSST